MKSYLYHIQLNIDFKNIYFYKNLLIFLGWKTIEEGKDIAGFKSGTNGDIWLLPKTKGIANNYDGNGMNHLALRVDKQTDIDEIITYLQKNKITMLFDTPKHRPEFVSGKNKTYYQVMFESPDKILFEVVYLGNKLKP